MSEPEHPLPSSQRQLTGWWQWPLPLSMLLLVVFGLTAPIETVLARDLLIVGSGAFLSGVLLWFVALPRWEADPDNKPGQAIELQRAMVAPLLTLLGGLIAGSGCALLVLPDDPMATKIIGALLVLLMIAVAGIVMIRARRLFMARSRREPGPAS